MDQSEFLDKNGSNVNFTRIDAVQEDQQLTLNESNTEAVTNGPEPQVQQSNEETVTNTNRKSSLFIFFNE